MRHASCEFYIKRRTGIDVVMCRIWLAGKSVLITDKSHERLGVLNHWLFRLCQRLFLLTTQKMMKTYCSVRVSETKSGLSGTLFKAVGGRPYLPDYRCREWRCSWGRSSNYIWVINNVIMSIRYGLYQRFEGICMLQAIRVMLQINTAYTVPMGVRNMLLSMEKNILKIYQRDYM